ETQALALEERLRVTMRSFAQIQLAFPLREASSELLVLESELPFTSQHQPLALGQLLGEGVEVAPAACLTLECDELLARSLDLRSCRRRSSLEHRDMRRLSVDPVGLEPQPVSLCQELRRAVCGVALEVLLTSGKGSFALVQISLSFEQLERILGLGADRMRLSLELRGQVPKRRLTRSESHLLLLELRFPGGELGREANGLRSSSL